MQKNKDKVMFVKIPLSDTAFAFLTRLCKLETLHRISTRETQ